MFSYEQILTSPFNELSDEVKVCYHFTDTPSKDSIQMADFGCFDWLPCTAEEWDCLIEACNTWCMEIASSSGLDTSYTELGYGGVSTDYTQRFFCPAHCLLKENAVVGFYYQGKLFPIGSRKVYSTDNSKSGVHEDTTYVDTTEMYLKKR